jgi:hypothetical protein
MGKASMGGTGGFVPSVRQAGVKSDTSPRSVFTDQTKLNKQIEKLQLMREEALQKLLGLSQF